MLLLAAIEFRPLAVTWIFGSFGDFGGRYNNFLAGFGGGFRTGTTLIIRRAGDDGSCVISTSAGDSLPAASVEHGFDIFPGKHHLIRW
jgi:hypothetical protein